MEELRGLKAENGLASDKNVEMLVHLNPTHAKLFQQHQSDLEKLVGVKEIHCVTEIPADSPKVVTLWGTFAIVLEGKKQLDTEALKQDIVKKLRS